MNKFYQTCICFFVIFLIGCDDSSNNKNYTRQECIVKIKMEHSNKESEVEENINMIADAITQARLNKRSNMPIVILPSSDRSLMYFQFRNNCEDKNNLAQSILDEEIIPLTRKNVSFNISTDAVIPSPLTIDYSGPDWVD